MENRERINSAVKYAKSYWDKYKEYLERGRLNVANQYLDMYSVARHTIELLIGSVPDELVAMEDNNG